MAIISDDVDNDADDANDEYIDPEHDYPAETPDWKAFFLSIITTKP